MTRSQQLLPWGLVLLMLGWWSRGVWPIVPIEGDEQGVIFGVEGMIRDDPALLQSRYLYDVQPGSYHLLAALTRISGASAEMIFGLTTIIGALVFAFVAACLLQLFLAWPLAWLLVALLWCQEVVTAAYYSNTSALAGAVALTAVLLAHRRGWRTWLASGLLLALAGWLRADSLLLAPACLGAAYWRERQWRPALQRTALIAIVALITVALLYHLCDTSLIHGFTSYTGRGYQLSGWRTLLETSLMLLSPVLALGGITGLVLLLWRRQSPVIFVVVCGVFASVAAYGTSLTTPKYFSYLTPFVLLPALCLIDTTRPWRRPILAGLGLTGIALCDGLLGLRTLDPLQRRFTTPTIWRLAQTSVVSRHQELVVGPGELIFNADGFRVRTGHLFAPECWHREKLRMQTDLATIRTWLDEKNNLTLMWSNWLPVQLVTRELLSSGFQAVSTTTTTGQEWHRAGQTVLVRYLGYARSPYQSSGPAPASTKDSATYLIGDCANQRPTELADNLSWHLLSSSAEGFLTLYQRR